MLLQFRNLSVVIMIIASCSGCATQPQYTSNEKHMFLSRGIISARKHIQTGRPQEANQFTKAILRIDPTNPDAISMDDELSGKLLYDCYAPSLIGVNRSKRIPVERSLFQRIAWYLPDRLLDLLDIVSGDLHFGNTFGANVHITRKFQAGVVVADEGTLGLGWYDQRNLGIHLKEEMSVSLLWVGAWYYNKFGIGTSGLEDEHLEILGVCDPKSPIFQESIDFWSAGASLSFYIGMSANIHPIEIADFFCGFTGVDIGNDDVALTRRLDLKKSDRNLLRELNRIYYVDYMEEKRELKAYEKELRRRLERLR